MSGLAEIGVGEHGSEDNNASSAKFRNNYIFSANFTMRTAIRNFLKHFGYDIIRLRKGPLKIYNGKSDVNTMTYHPTPIGNYYLPKTWGDDWMSYNMKRGLFSEPEVIDLAQRFVKPGTVVLDLGANFGQMSIAFSKMVGSAGRVYSFEAQKAVFEIFSKNIAANDIKNITPLYNAVYDKDGEVLYFPTVDRSVHKSLGSFSIDPGKKEGEEIRTITIDSLNIETPVSFMKVDIQGSDIFAMRGAIQTIRKYQFPIIFEFEQQFQKQFQTSFQDYVDFVKQIGYRFAEVNETPFEINYLIVPQDFKE